MKITKFLSRLSRTLRKITVSSSMVLPGVAVLAGGMAFVGSAHAASIALTSTTVILSEDFENDGDDRWGGGADTFGTYHSTLNRNWSDSPHASIPDGGLHYGHLINTIVFAPGTHASINGGPLVSAAIDLTLGHDTINFDGWVAAWTNEGDHTRFEAEFFDGLGGGGSSLGVAVLVDGSLFNSLDGVTESVNSSGDIIPGDTEATAFNWKHYITSNPIPAGAMSVEISYVGDSTTNSNKNDAYAENVVITTSRAVPEPASVALVGLGVAGLLGAVLLGAGRHKK